MNMHKYLEGVVCTPECRCPLRPEVSHPLELQIQALVKHLTRGKLNSDPLQEQAHALNHRVFSPDLSRL